MVNGGLRRRVQFLTTAIIGGGIISLVLSTGGLYAVYREQRIETAIARAALQHLESMAEQGVRDRAILRREVQKMRQSLKRVVP